LAKIGKRWTFWSSINRKKIIYFGQAKKCKQPLAYYLIYSALYAIKSIAVYGESFMLLQ